jgi:hypothetical protein
MMQISGSGIRQHPPALVRTPQNPTGLTDDDNIKLTQIRIFYADLHDARPIDRTSEPSRFFALAFLFQP